jgi:mRNA-degrading endonuclease RelE of RelBE toxin-antitoxin system
MLRFERRVKQLKKRYRRIADDLTQALESIEENPSIGPVIPDDYLVQKLRVASRDMQRGKSGGFRLLYKLSSEEGDDITVYLLFIYAKSDQPDVTTAQLKSFIDDISDDE